MLPELDYKKTTLKNGIRVITVPMKSTAAVTSLVLVGVGAHYELKRLSGVSHYLEHLVFKGSKKYANAGKISAVLDGLGASYNAVTSDEYTGFYVKTSADNTQTALDVIADYLKNPLFKPVEVERERGPITEELKMDYDNLPRHAYSLFREILYGDQPAGRDIGGTEKSVSNIKRADIKRHFDTYYGGENVCIVFAGDISHTQGRRLANKFFGSVKLGGEIEKIEVINPKPLATGRVIVKNKQNDQSHLVMGFKGLSGFDKRIHTLYVLSMILGGGMSSRLFREIREKRGLAYYVGAGEIIGSDYGHFVVRAGVAHNNLIKSLRVIIKEINKIKKQIPTLAEMQKVKSRIEGLTALSIEESSGIAFDVGTDELIYKKIETPLETIEKINGVKASHVMELANDIFKKDMARLAIIGPHSSKKELEEILNII